MVEVDYHFWMVVDILFFATKAPSAQRYHEVFLSVFFVIVAKKTLKLNNDRENQEPKFVGYPKWLCVLDLLLAKHTFGGQCPDFPKGNYRSMGVQMVPSAEGAEQNGPALKPAFIQPLRGW